MQNKENTRIFLRIQNEVKEDMNFIKEYYSENSLNHCGLYSIDFQV